MTWPAILVLAAGAYAFKAGGFLGLSRVALRPRAAHIVALLPAALLSGLIALQVIGNDSTTLMWTRSIGVAVGAAAIWRRAPLPVVIVISAATAAALRMIV